MLQIRRLRVLRGPSIWAHRPAIELLLDLGEIKDRSSEEIPGFNARLKSWLPSLIEHHCSPGERGGFFQRLDRGTYMAHILEHVTLELQTLAGTPVGFGRARETDEDGVYRVAIEYEEEALGLAAVETARSLLLAAIHDRPFDLADALGRLRDLCHAVRLGPSTHAIARAAKARGIPVRRLGSENLLQLGWGYRKRRVWTAETDRTSAIAEAIAQDKDLTRLLLAAAGVPVPEGQPVESTEEAWRFAQELGAPVVVKPRYGNHGRGVTTQLSTPGRSSRVSPPPARRVRASCASATSRVPTFACWWSANGWWRPPGANRPRSSVMVSPPSASWWPRSIATRAAARVMPPCSA